MLNNPNFRDMEHKIDFKYQVRLLEAILIRDALEKAQGNQSLAARILGLSRTTLIKKIKEGFVIPN